MKNKKRKNRSTELSNIKANISTAAKRVSVFFSTEPQKEKVLSHEDFTPAGDVYYASVSAKYKVAQRVLSIFLVFFLLVSIITNFREITFDNMFYLARDFASAADESNNNYETLSYESDSRQRFALFRGGIASVSPSKLSVFTATGRRTLNETVEFSSPYMVSSDKYLLVYDTANKVVEIYNSFARIYSKTLDKQIKGACLADNGAFALITENTGESSCVRIYDKNFELKAEWNDIPGYVFNISLDSTGKRIAVLSYSTDSGIGNTKLTVVDVSKIQSSKGSGIPKDIDVKYSGETPIKCGFTDNGGLSVITDSHIRFLNADYEEIQISDNYSGGRITGYSVNKYGTAVSIINQSHSMILGYNNKGTLVYDRIIPYNVLDLCMYGEYLFVKTEQGVVRINVKKQSSEIMNSGNGKMLVYNENTALVCGESKAEYIVFED